MTAHTLHGSLVHALQDGRPSEEGEGQIEVKVRDGGDSPQPTVLLHQCLLRGKAQLCQVTAEYPCEEGEERS